MNNPHTEEVLKQAKDEWSAQGRTEEQIYGVTNFFTGRGKKLLEDVYSQGRNAGIEEAREELKKIQGIRDLFGEKGAYIPRRVVDAMLSSLIKK